MKHKIFLLLFAIVAGISSTMAAITVRLSAQSCSDWTSVYLWAWSSNGNVFDVSWPGVKISQEEDGWYSYTFDQSLTTVNIIWTNGDGDQTIDITGISSSTCFALKSSTGTNIGVNIIDCSTGEQESSIYEHVKIGDLYYNLNGIDNSAEVTYQEHASEENYLYLTTVVIPTSVVYNGNTYTVQNIGIRAFYGCTGLTSVTIPNSVTNIGLFAFLGCSGLTSIEIPNSVTSIGDQAFSGCTSLTSVTIPNSVTSIGRSAFSSCSGLTSIEIPNSVTSIGEGAFSSCSSLTSVTISNSVTSIEMGTFANSGLTSVEIPNSVTNIGDMAFYECTGLTSVTIGNSVTSIGNDAFVRCTGLTSVSIPNSVTSIGNYAFRGCTGLTSPVFNAHVFVFMPTTFSGIYTIQDGIESIAGGAFEGCTGLTSVTIPNSVTSIGRYAFRGCTGLTSVAMNSIIPPAMLDYDFLYDHFADCYSLNAIYAPCGALNAYKSAEVWYAYESIIKYAPLPYAITINATNGSVNVPQNICEELTARPYNGYHFVQWSDGVTDNPRTIELTQDTTLEAIFVHNPVIKYIYDASRGSISGDTITPTGVASAPITFEATAEYGYHFVQWADGVTDNPRTIELTQDTTMEAIFAPNKYAISVTCDTTKGSIEGENGEFDYKSELIYRAIPNYGYHLHRWSDSYYTTENPRTITLLRDTTIEAIYAPNTYTIRDGSNYTQGYVYGVGSYEYLSERQLTAIPARGLYFVQWADGIKDNPRTIELTQDTTMEAIFDYLPEGKCGKDSVLNWTLDTASMALNITGRGALSDIYTYTYDIESVTIGNEVTLIGQSAFYGCNQLKKVIVGSSVKVLEEYAFYDCRAIETITCYSQRPPTVNNSAFSNLDYSTIVYVPADYLETYKMHDVWGLYDVRPLGAKTTEATDVEVKPADNTADVVWPAVEGAATYELVIKDKDGNVICTLIFNANGQLTQIAFGAPARNKAPQQTQAAGFEFTVTGLEEGTSYDLTMTSKDSEGQTLAEKTVSFTTTGGEQGVEDVQGKNAPCTKILRNGQLIIIRGNKMYNAQGIEL